MRSGQGRRRNPVGERLRFERGARSAYPTLRGTWTSHTAGGVFRYVLDIDVPCYETRHLTIVFRHPGAAPVIHADGPDASPHRYDDGSLCLWFPMDPTAHRWGHRDGLLDLLDAITAHLFREAWWRETGDWLGPEVAHGPVAAEGAA